MKQKKINKVSAYHLQTVHVPLVVRVPQVGNPWSRLQKPRQRNKTFNKKQHLYSRKRRALELDFGGQVGQGFVDDELPLLSEDEGIGLDVGIGLNEGNDLKASRCQTQMGWNLSHVAIINIFIVNNNINNNNFVFTIAIVLFVQNVNEY